MSRLCSSCNVPADPQTVPGLGITRLNCRTCGRCVALLCADGTCTTPDDMITDSASRNGWIHVQTAEDRVMLYVLSQVVYQPRTYEVPFDLPDPHDIVAVAWQQGKAIGFYTMKPRGSHVVSTMETYAMNTVDTVFIHPAHRRRGHAYAMLLDVTTRFPEQDLAFSSPISHNMWRVLEKFLQENAVFRDKFWIIENTGIEGHRKLIWYCIKKMRGATGSEQVQNTTL